MNELQLWQTKVQEQGLKITKLLAADSAQSFEATVRGCYATQAEVSPPMTLSSLKGKTLAAAQATSLALERALSPGVWLSAPVPERGPSAVITDHQGVATALDERDAALDTFLKTHGFSAPDQSPRRLPARFIDGDNLASLSRSYWKALSRYRELEQGAQTAQALVTADARRAAWDQI